MIKQLRREYPLGVLCRVLRVSQSGYHAWLVRHASKRTLRRERLKVAIAAAHQRTRHTYGSRRLQHELRSDGFHASLGVIKSLRREMGVTCVQTKKRWRVVTTDSNHSSPIAANLLEQNFTVEHPNQVWSADITYVPSDEGWLYVAAIKDLFTGEIVGRSCGERLTTELVTRALRHAVATRRPAAGVIHHSDRGSQYASDEYRRLVAAYGMRASMSRKGNCYDNAPIESFWGSLKTELVHHQEFMTRREAERAVVEYIDIFYNRQRRQARLGYISPTAFRQAYEREQQQAALKAA